MSRASVVKECHEAYHRHHHHHHQHHHHYYRHHHHYHHQRQVMSRASVAKECYEAHRQPWEAEQLEEESVKKVKTSLVDLIIV